MTSGHKYTLLLVNPKAYLKTSQQLRVPSRSAGRGRVHEVDALAIVRRRSNVLI